MSPSTRSRSKPKPTTAKWSWQDVAKEAQEYRDGSLKLVPENHMSSLDFLDHSKAPITLPDRLLDEEDSQITRSLPEDLIRKMASGEWSATNVTLAFLRRATIAQKLVSMIAPQISCPKLRPEANNIPDKLHNRTPTNAIPPKSHRTRCLLLQTWQTNRTTPRPAHQCQRNDRYERPRT